MFLVLSWINQRLSTQQICGIDLSNCAICILLFDCNYYFSSSSFAHGWHNLLNLLLLLLNLFLQVLFLQGFLKLWSCKDSLRLLWLRRLILFRFFFSSQVYRPQTVIKLQIKTSCIVFIIFIIINNQMLGKPLQQMLSEF